MPVRILSFRIFNFIVKRVRLKFILIDSDNLCALRIVEVCSKLVSFLFVSNEKSCDIFLNFCVHSSMYLLMCVLSKMLLILLERFEDFDRHNN